MSNSNIEFLFLLQVVLLQVTTTFMLPVSNFASEDVGSNANRFKTNVVSDLNNILFPFINIKFTFLSSFTHYLASIWLCFWLAMAFFERMCNISAAKCFFCPQFSCLSKPSKLYKPVLEQ
jgi:hypothetical protein